MIGRKMKSFIRLLICLAIQFVLFLIYKYGDYSFWLYIFVAIIIANVTFPWVVYRASEDDDDNL